ncbi:MAG: energy transducer TonB [Candidatus Ratteibacteria bacterium]|jgi:TonB family protein
MNLFQKTLTISFIGHAVILTVFALALPSRVMIFTQIPVELASLPEAPPVLGQGRGRPLTTAPVQGVFRSLVGIYLPSARLAYTGPAVLEPGVVPPTLSSVSLLPSAARARASLPLIVPEGNVGRGFSSEAAFKLSGPGAKRKLISAPLPYYPKWAKERGVEAYLELKMWIDSSGNVQDVSILKSSGYSDLDRICTETISRWRFDPEEGQPTWAILPLRFHLI